MKERLFIALTVNSRSQSEFVHSRDVLEALNQFLYAREMEEVQDTFGLGGSRIYSTIIESGLRRLRKDNERLETLPNEKELEVLMRS